MRAIALLLIPIAWGILLSRKWGPIPPLGPFLSPFEGFWRNAEIREPRLPDPPSLPGLSGTASVEMDKRGVPHVFAARYRELFFAQGYVTARDRLFQMDIASRAAVGRLSEVLGPNLMRFDLERRRMGMPATARIEWTEIQKDSLARLALWAYADGVNAWIGSLTRRELPLEFKLLHYAPEPWTPLKSVALIKNLQWTLTKASRDVPLTRSLEKLGGRNFASLFPLRNPDSKPVLPRALFAAGLSDSMPAPEEDSVALDAAPLDSAPEAPAVAPTAPPTPEVDSAFPRPEPGAGSNNLALAGSRTASGRAMLANDPHLDLTLPSIWYEIQLRAEDANAYGVSVPGLPGVVIGFNAHIAWGLTNGMDDVFDWHHINFQDATLSRYFWNGTWRNSRRIVDTLAVRGRKPVIDTQVWTHLGPVPVKPGETPFERNAPPVHALRWLALDPGNTLGPFLRLLPARGYEDFRRALSGLHCPSQNVAFADDSGGIALWHQGRIPIKPLGRGRIVVRGADSTREWREFLPDSLLPRARNPERGWLASANQEPADSAYAFYLGSQFEPSERAGRLESLLSALPREAATLEGIWSILLEDRSLHAEKALPLLLADVAGAALSPGAQKAAALLRAWQPATGHKADAAAPALFELWWKHFHFRTWSDDFGGDSAQYAWPSRAVTRRLLETAQPSPWFDDAGTAARETSQDIAAAALEAAAEEARIQAGSPDSAAWGRIRPVSIPHLLRLAPLGRLGMRGNGCGECLNAQRESHGPSWRMVVEPGEKPRALGGYPGGQSGNPGSPAYDAFVDDWLAGKPYSLLYLENPGELPDSIAYRFTLRGNSSQGRNP